ncbi:hypothetical protein L596_023689 [Steinernema carpocapsae]|nr:hypothetical protein L596_023689 [Steinernema carpocapsae]
MIKLAFGKPCDTTNATFKEVLFECRFPQQPIRFPDSAIQKRFFQRYYIALMERYAGIVREYPVAKKEELAKDTRILAIEERLKLTHFEFHSNDRVESFDPVNYLYPFGFRPEDMFDNDDALFGSREYALTYPKAGIRFMLMPNRAKALLKCAMKLLKGESVSADELKYYDVESIRLVLSKEERPETVPYDNKRELLELLGDFYVEYAQDHTIAIGRKHLDFLSEPRSHLKLLEMYRKIFTFGHVDTSYLSDHYDD